MATTPEQAQTDASSTAGVPLPKHLASLTGLRAIAATAVLGYHLLPYFAAALPGSGPWVLFARAGSLGVDLFFALSGFVLAHVYLTSMGDHPTWRGTLTFWWLRLARIYPVYLVTLIVATGWIYVQGRWGDSRSGYPDWFTAEEFIGQVYLFPDFRDRLSAWNVPAWSIHAEMLAYLMFPFLIVLIAWLARRRLAWWFYGALAFACYVPFMLAVFEVWDISPIPGYEPVLRIATEFCAGVLLYVAVRKLRSVAYAPQRLVMVSRFGVGIACTALIIGAILLQQRYGNELWLRTDRPTSFNPPQRVQALAPLLALIIASLGLGAGLHRRGFLAGRPMVAAGNASYSEYMWHVLVIGWLAAIANRGFGEGTAGAGWFVLLIAPWLVWVVGFLSFRWFEEPTRVRLRRLQRVPPTPVTLEPPSPAENVTR